MKDVVKLDVKGIKCDNSNCDFIDMSVEFEDYENWLNKSCPKCEDDEVDISVSVEMNGTDKIKFIHKEEENE